MLRGQGITDEGCIVKRAGNYRRGDALLRDAGNYIRGDALLRGCRAGNYIRGDALLRGQGITCEGCIVKRALHTRGCIVKRAGNYIRGDALLRGQGITYEGMHC